MTTQTLPTIPESSSTVDVSIIDSSFRLFELPTSMFMGPELEGFEKFGANAYSFLITHQDAQTGTQTKLLFDLGAPKNWEEDLPLPLVEGLRKVGGKLEIDKYVSEILEENGVALDTIDAVVWSHTHWDHVGRPSLFPGSTTLIVGPGVKEAYAPGYPEKASSPILSREFANRTVTELNFSTSDLEIGGFQALDYFGDGSLYFLSAPGHAVGHIIALARTSSSASSSFSSSSSKSSTITTNTDKGPGTGTGSSTFILMGADSFHHASELRPHQYAPLPDTISLEDSGPDTPTTSKTASVTAAPSAGHWCPGSIFEPIHPSSPHRHAHIPSHYKDEIDTHHADPRRTPFFTVSQKPDGETIAVDIDQARATIRGLQPFDGDENVLVIAAHDFTLAPVVDYFPALANQWKQNGWKEKGRWRFLEDLLPAVEVAKGKQA